MRFIIFTFSFLLLFGDVVAKPVQAQDTLSLLDDPSFKRGLKLKRAEQPVAGHIYPFESSKEEPAWEMAEWGSGLYLSADDKRVSGKKVSYANPNKRITFGQLKTGTSFAMDVVTSKEYKSPRKSGESWPHLLIEQSFSKKIAVKDLKDLTLHFTGRLTKAQLKMPKEAFDPGLHTAQFQLYLVVQDLNPKSAGLGDYVWVGIPFYDYRKRTIPVYAAQDLGKDDATGKFIYSAASVDFMKGSFVDGNWISISKNIYPVVVEALKIAKQRGYLAKSDLADFKVAGVNIGWEVSGTLDVGFECKYFDLLAVTGK